MTHTTLGACAALALALASPLAAQAADAMRVVRDPGTGELRAPNAAEAAAFEKAEAQLRAAKGKPAVSQPTEIRYADGTVETKLGEDTMMYSVVAANADGTLTMDCLPAKEAAKFVNSPPKKSTAAKAATKADHAHQ